MTQVKAPEPQTVIELIGVKKRYQLGRSSIEVLHGIDLKVSKGEFVVIMGPSGSGKSTLMNIIGCLDRVSEGTYLLAGEDVSSKTPVQLATVRNRKIGFVFQNYNLLPRLTAVENAELPLVYRGIGPAARRRKAIEQLTKMGLAARVHHKPSEMSGGEQQRVAIARALVGDPEILLADEPTGNLDSKVGAQIMSILVRLNDAGMTIVMVTHDPEIALYGKRIVRLKDGLLVGDEPVQHRRTPPDEHEGANAEGAQPRVQAGLAEGGEAVPA
ncbi:MAG TPA: ABC transporter ATP-binding protein [Firmicutes bacterium]|nr:ABC transporter ATP-binding protein [Bacillota bacterium]